MTMETQNRRRTSYRAGTQCGIAQAKAGLPPIRFSEDVPKEYVGGFRDGYELVKLVRDARI